MVVSIRALVVFVVLLITSVASAAVIVTQPWDGTKNGFLSKGSSILVAEDFSISSPVQISTITWSGYTANGQVGIPSPPSVGDSQSFIVRFYADSPTPPFNASAFDHSPASPALISQTLSALVTDVQAIPSTSPQAFKADFQLSLATPIELQSAGAYWLSIASGGGSPDLYWLGTDPGQTLVYSGGAGWFEERSSSRSNLVFALQGAIVPEPASVAMFIAVAVVLRRPRRICRAEA
jgi:hypothetical protein